MNNSSSFKYKSSILEKSVAINNGIFKFVKAPVLLKHLSNVWISLDMLLINCKIHLGLNWAKSCAMSDIAGDTKVKITNTKIHVPIVTLPTKDNLKLIKQLNWGFKRPFCWNEYKTKMEFQNLDDNNLTRFYLDVSFQRVKRWFVAFNNTTADVAHNPVNNTNNKVVRDGQGMRVIITNCNVLIDGRTFYDEPIGDQIQKYEKIRKITTRQGNDYTLWCLLDY